MHVQNLIYLLGALAGLAAWGLWGYCAYRNVTSKPAKFYLCGWTCNIDRRTQPLAFTIYLTVALAVFLISGFCCALLVYYKVLPLFAG